MGFETALAEELQSISGLSDKIFHSHAPESTAAPYVVVVSSPGDYDKTLEGFLSSKSVHCELNIVCDTYESLKTITPEVIQSLQSFVFRTIGTDGPYIQDLTILETPLEGYVEEAELHVSIVEFRARF